MARIVVLLLGLLLVVAGVWGLVGTWWACLAAGSLAVSAAVLDQVGEVMAQRRSAR